MRLLGFSAVLLALAASGCGGHPAPHAAPSAPAAPSHPTSPDASPDGPTLVVSANGSSVTCLEKVTTADLAFRSETLTASTPLRITAAKAVGHGVRVLGGLVVPVVGGNVSSIEVSDWPLVAEADLRKEVAWSARTQLLGARIPVQRPVLPVLHLRAIGGAALSYVQLGFETDSGRVGTVRVPMGIRFSRTTC